MMTVNLLLPELIILSTAFLVLVLDFVFLKGEKRWLDGIAMAGVVVSGVFAVTLMGEPGAALGGRFALSDLALWFKLIFLAAGFLTLSLAGEPFGRQARHPMTHRGEFLAILLFTLGGMLFLVSSRDLVSLYVSLELATVPLFALSAWSRTEKGGEGALKYLVMGAMASAFLLYGFGFLYGLTGKTDLGAIARGLQQGPVVWLAAGMILAGLGFKLTLFPFHMWAPDAYEGAPTPVTAYLSVASKAAGLTVAFQLLYGVFGSRLAEWATWIALIACLTMTLGNFVAILQEDLKRFMAYSGISQAGYLMLGFLGGFLDKSASAMVFYMLVYVLTNLAAFAVLSLHIHQRGGESVASLRGLSRSNPLLALALMIALFGLAGIPPLSGFVGKFFLFSAAAKAGFYWVVGIAAINSTVSLYYYLRIVRQMYIENPDEKAAPLRVSPVTGFGIGVATLGSVVCGLHPFFYERMSADALRWFAGQ